MPIFNSLAQALLFALTLLLLPTIAHTPMRQFTPPQQANKPVVAQKQPTYTTFEVTAYTNNDFSMNGKGITASGIRAKRWHTVAASRSYPIGARIHLVELGKTFVVEDRGGAIRNNRLDIYVGDMRTALQFGRQKLKGVVLPPSP